MRIRSKVALVGSIPIVIAAAIAVVAWLLLNEAERARSGAVVAGAAYRDLVAVMVARDEYLRLQPQERERGAERFEALAGRARVRLDELAARSREPEQRSATSDVQRALSRYREQMGRLREVTDRNDRLISEMSARASALIALTDKARERQHASNADIITSITEGDRRLRLARDLVDRAQEVRAAALTAALERARLGDGIRDAGATRLAGLQIRNAAQDLAEVLERAGQPVSARELSQLTQDIEGEGGQRLGAWIDRLIKINATEQRSLHEEVTQLLTYSVQAAETEQATQNIAIETLKLGRGTSDALAARDVVAVSGILSSSAVLASTMAALPISPLIQTEMIDAVGEWRDRLATTRNGLGAQNGFVAEMDATAALMVAGASGANDLFARDADRIGQFVRTILALGAAVGLLLGSGTAYLVARSITRPLRQLQDRMIALAADPSAGPIEEAHRRDELGAMAGAANFFLREIASREADLRQAKDRADAALAELREAQSSLIQAEKLASLGQLVAGVAHEINTPVGVALTTATALEREAKLLREGVSSGRVLRSELARTVDRLTEGSRLLFANLNRAADLVHSFKQVATDQASGEQRRFELKAWIREVLTSLGPVIRKTGLDVVVECPEGIVLDSHPGALAQVITNLITNARDHAYPEQRGGRLTLTVTLTPQGCVRLVFADDGVGIPPHHLAKVFDPFYTTRRERGSTGLGLHIVHNLVTGTLQGRIVLDSAQGLGTRFTIDIPPALEGAAEPQRLSA